MIPTKVSTIAPGDIIRFSENGKTHTVTHAHIHTVDGDLRALKFEDLEEVAMPGQMEVFAVQMIRVVKIPCLARRHGPDPVVVLHDLAAHPVPRAVICGNCDDEITAEVVRQMEEEGGA